MEQQVSFAIHNTDLVYSQTHSTQIPPPPPPSTEPQDALNSLLTIVNMANSIGPSVMLSTPVMETLIIDARQNDAPDIEELLAQTLDNNPQQLERNEEVVLDINKVAYSSTDKTETECPICCSNFIDDENVSITSCKHYFHSNCLVEWGHYNTACPVCRTDIPVIDKKENAELE
jgi:hypothetical protein